MLLPPSRVSFCVGGSLQGDDFANFFGFVDDKVQKIDDDYYKIKNWPDSNTYVIYYYQSKGTMPCSYNFYWKLAMEECDVSEKVGKTKWFQMHSKKWACKMNINTSSYFAATQCNWANYDDSTSTSGDSE